MIGLLLLGCIGLVGFRAVAVGIKVAWIAGGGASGIVQQDVPPTESPVPSESKLAGEEFDPPVDDSGTAVSSGNQSPPMKTAVGPSASKPPNVAGLVLAIERVAGAGEAVTGAARRWTSALAAAVRPQVEGLRALRRQAARGPILPGAPSDAHADTESVDDRPATAVLVNNAAAAVRYLIDGGAYSLEAGQTHVLREDGPWTIHFHRGGDFGDTSRHVHDGTHQFSVTTGGWELQPR